MAYKGWLLLILLVQPSVEVYAEDSTIVQLTAENFDEEVTSSKKFWIVQFYVPTSTTFNENYKKIAKKLRENFSAGAVDCVDEKPLCELCKIRINEFPRIQFLYNRTRIPFEGPLDVGQIEFAAGSAKAVFDRQVNPLPPAVSGVTKHFNIQKLFQALLINFMIREISYQWTLELIFFSFLIDFESHLLSNCNLQQNYGQILWSLGRFNQWLTISLTISRLMHKFVIEIKIFT